MQNLTKPKGETDIFTSTLQINISQTPAQQASCQVLSTGGTKRRPKGRKGTPFLFLAAFINIIQAGSVQPSNDNLPRLQLLSVLLLLLLLSHFSRVRLCATPETSAHQAPPFLGFSRQEHWSGLPFPCPMHESEK